MVVGARTGKNVAYEWPHRAIPKLFIRKLASYLTNHPIPDLNSGLRLYKKNVAMKYFYLYPDSHSFVSTITMAFLCSHYQVEFFPIDYYKRKGGPSTFSPIRDTYNYVSLVIRTIMAFNPLRFFIPVGGAIMLAGGIKMIYDWEVYRVIGSLDVSIFLAGLLTIFIGLLADLIVVTSRRREHEGF